MTSRRGAPWWAPSLNHTGVRGCRVGWAKARLRAVPTILGYGKKNGGHATEPRVRASRRFCPAYENYFTLTGMISAESCTSSPKW